MPARRHPLLVALAGLLALLAALGLHAERAQPRRRIAVEVDGARFRLDPSVAREAGVAPLPPLGPLHFAAGTSPADEQAVLAAVAGARPEARRIIALVSELVTVSIGAPGPGIAGLTTWTPQGFDVELDLASVSRRYGVRGIARTTLHELGHVVDGALVTTPVEQELDAATPPGWGCEDGGLSGACAARPERFAESFAKWAMHDIGDDLDLGYRVPPPTDLDTWGDPLTAVER